MKIFKAEYNCTRLLISLSRSSVSCSRDVGDALSSGSRRFFWQVQRGERKGGIGFEGSFQNQSTLASFPVSNPIPVPISYSRVNSGARDDGDGVFCRLAFFPLFLRRLCWSYYLFIYLLLKVGSSKHPTWTLESEVRSLAPGPGCADAVSRVFLRGVAWCGPGARGGLVGC